MPSRPPARLLAGLALLVALLAGCGSDDGDDAATTATAETPQAGAGFKIQGSWSGVLTEPGLAPFTVDAKIESLRRPSRNQVRYRGSINCDDRWAYLGRAGEAFRFREELVRARGGDCFRTGTLTLTPLRPDEVRFRYRGGGTSSAGVLTRGG